MNKRNDRDESYVLDLCDSALKRIALREYRFAFLRGDSGRTLPVDAYYAELNLVIEYQERQHSESVPIFDKRMTVSGVARGVQRALYDQRRRDVLPIHGIQLIEFNYSDFAFGSGKRLKRIVSEDAKIIRSKIRSYL